MNKERSELRKQFIRENVIGYKYNPLKDDKGLVTLIDFMGTDYDILEAARISFLNNNDVSKGDEADKKLLEYLLKNSHTSPFEQVYLKFKIVAPIMVMNQWQRHRTWKYLHINEASRRYTSDEVMFYVPDDFRNQSKSNKQGSIEDSRNDKSAVYSKELNELCENGFYWYKEAISDGIAKEQARMFLPAYNLYTNLIVTVDLHNLLHFLKLRMDEHAQWEIRQYANAIYNIVSHVFPETIEVWSKLNNESNS